MSKLEAPAQMQSSSKSSNPSPDPDVDDASSKRQATRVFKKSSANGKITVYLGKRDFVDHITHVDPIDGVVLIDPDYVKDRKVFGNVLAAFRYGREDLDVLGLTFRKDLYLASEQIFPMLNETNEKPLTRLQERLIKKLGPNAYPFFFEVPPHCPASVSLQPAPGDTGKPCGVDYELKAFVGECSEDKPHKRNSVRLAIRKIMYAPSKLGEQPSIEVSKEFMLKPNKIHLEASLDKELYHHGESIAVNVHIANNSSKTVKKIKVSVRQFADICLFSTAQYKCTVAEVESEDNAVAPGFTLSKVFTVRPLLKNNKFQRGLALDGQLKHEDTNLASSTLDGCQVQPGFTLSKVFTLTPLLVNNKDKWGLALDGQLKHEDTNLASSTLIPDPTQRENLGIIVQYKVKVKLCITPLGGDLVAELPFILMHPKPVDIDDNIMLDENSSPNNNNNNGKARNSIGEKQHGVGANSSAAKDEAPNLIQLDGDDTHDDDIIFEDFARLRLKGGETEA